MKQTLLNLFMIGLLVVGLSACGNDDSTDAASPDEPAAVEQKPVTQEDLLHHRFVLKSANDVSYEGKERVPDLEFLEGLRVAAGVCNRMSGQGELKDGKLVVKQMAATMMMCAEEDLNKLERDFGAVLAEGADIKIEGNTLILSGSGLTLIYETSDWL